MAGLDQNQWQLSIGISGKLRLESMAGLNRNQWQHSTGIRTQQGHRQNPAQSEMRYPSQRNRYPTQPMTPQYGNTTPQQGHRQNPAQSEMRYPSEREAMRMILQRQREGEVCSKGADGREIVLSGMA